MLDADGLAGELQVSLHTIRRYDASGTIPRPIKLGGRLLRWPRAEIVAWMEAGCPDRREWEEIKSQRERRSNSRR